MRRDAAPELVQHGTCSKPPNRRLLSMRAYARRIGVNVSTISRQVADGVIPIGYEQGRKGIDPDEADAARAACLHPFWGGKRVPIE